METKKTNDRVKKNKETSKKIPRLNILILLKKYEKTQSPLLPKINLDVIKNSLSHELHVKKIINDTKAIWPIQFLLLLENPKKAGGRWADIFCHTLIKIGFENVLKNASNQSIYNFVMKDNFEIFQQVRNELHKISVIAWEKRQRHLKEIEKKALQNTKTETSDLSL